MRPVRILAGLCGIAGPLILVSSFMINPAPPAGLAGAALVAWARPHKASLLLGGWMQGIGSLLMVIFCLAMIDAAGAANRLSGRLTQLAATTILCVSLIEVTFYLAAGSSIASGDMTLGLVSSGLIKAVQHVFLIAPALLLPLGFVLATTRLIGRLLAWSALLIGASLQGLGLAGIFMRLQPVIDVVLIVQAAWFVLAGLAFAIGRSERARRDLHASQAATDAWLA